MKKKNSPDVNFEEEEEVSRGWVLYVFKESAVLLTSSEVNSTGPIGE